MSAPKKRKARVVVIFDVKNYDTEFDVQELHEFLDDLLRREFRQWGDRKVRNLLVGVSD